MEEDQQFCLRWNNHQSTLISVFDTLLENGTLVDCTLAAEGKFLKAHKVVLSACSPYFATLLSEQYDKHPIFILKDVKYQELRAMMDYMYRGEVNISQDQLAALLKAAESLQIKGLSDNRGGAGSGGSKAGEPQKHSTTGHHVPGKMTNIGHMGAGYTLEQAKRARIGPSSIDSQDIGGSREGSSSPTSRRRKKIRRRSVDNVMGDNHENSNSSQNMQINSSVTGPGAITTSIVPSGAVAQAASGNQIQTQTNKKTDNLSKLDQGVSVSTINPTASATANVSDEHDEDGPGSNKKEHHLQSAKKDKEVVGVSGSATSSDIVIEPKSEYDDGNEETVEDLTLDDEMALDELDQTAGPSHGGEGSSQGYAQWQVDRSHDESYMAQDVQQRDPQDLIKCEQGMMIGSSDEIKNERFPCQVCGKSYLRKRHLQRHMRDECIGIPPRFSCELCPSKFRRKYHMVRHIQSKHSGTPQALQLASVKEEIGGHGGNLSSSNLENYENDMAAASALAAFSNGSAGGGGSTSGSVSGNDSPNMFCDFRTYAGTMAAALYPTSDSPGQAMGINIKNEPLSPGKAAQKMEDDWKMKLSLQLISNSLLKERLMNAMPFAYNKN